MKLVLAMILMAGCIDEGRPEMKCGQRPQQPAVTVDTSHLPPVITLRLDQWQPIADWGDRMISWSACVCQLSDVCAGPDIFGIR